MTSNGKQPNGTPRVTVALPTYNRAGLLREALDSVLAQTFTDFVVVVSDNASTDETPEVVASYGDPRIVYRRQDHNVGWIANFNSALSGAETDYGIFMSDDDLLRPGLLGRAVEVLDAHPGVGIFHSAFDIIDGSGNVRMAGMDWTGHLPCDAQESGLDFIRLSMAQGCRVCSSTAVLRLSCVPWPAYEPKAGFPGDLLLYLRMGLTRDVYFAREALGAYRVHEGSISAGEWANVITGQYRPKVSAILQVRKVKLRFLRESGARLPDARSLRYDAERAALDSYYNNIVRTHIPQPVRRAVKALVPGRARAAQVP